jgi:hypothetical protein
MRGHSGKTEDAQRAMIALDTNLLARLLLEDDAAQKACAKAILKYICFEELPAARAQSASRLGWKRIAPAA